MIDKIAPFRSVRLRSDTQPWMTTDILGGIKKRNVLFSKVKRNRGNSELYREYCTQRNLVQRMIKDAKASYFNRSIIECGNDSSKMWRQFRSLGYKSRETEGGIVLEDNGDLHFNPADTANIFNKFYSSVASSLVDKLPSPSGLFGLDFCHNFYRKKGIFGPCFSLSPVSRRFVHNQLATLKADKSTGLDGISPRLLRDGAAVLADPITHIINLSLSSEIVPTGFKHARVRPLYKKGSRQDPGNYRPVSILPVLSKLLERAVNDQLCSFLSKKKLLYDFQSGFRKGFSTDTCLLNLTDYIKSQSSKGNFTGMVLIDLQKAFDCVDHNLLLSKLKAMGIGSVDWFRSYLNDRSQCTQVRGIDSDFLNITCGVPQGSILGPTLFLCYINDMADVLKCKLSLYADDSALVFSDSDPSLVAQFLSAELKVCRDWLIDNRLSLHLGKTECILFGSKRRLKSETVFDVKLGDSTVKRVSTVKYLGVVLDQFLDFSEHVDSCLKKSTAKLHFLYRYSQFLNERARKLLCQTLIFSNVEYCASSWYLSLKSTYKESLNVLQRKCARFVLHLPPRSHIGPYELSGLSWLPFPKRVAYFSLVHAFKVKNGLSPEYLANEFTGIADVHSHSLRQSHVNFSIARCSSPTGTFTRHTISDWNSLPSEIKVSQSVAVFKSRLKTYLHSH